jgi:hypothetical protein
MDSSIRNRWRAWLARFLAGGLVAFVVFESLCLVFRVLLPFFPSLYGDSGKLSGALLDAESGLFFSSAALAPLFVAGLMFSWVLLACIWLGEAFFSIGKKGARFAIRIGGEKVAVEKLLSSLESMFEQPFHRVTGQPKRWLWVLALSVTLASLIAIYPYLPSLNSNGRPVGADIPAYVKWLKEIDGNGTGTLWDAFSRASLLERDRPLSLFLMYLGLKTFGISNWQTIQFLPVLLSPLLVLSTFFFMREAGFSSWTASMAGLFTAFSFHITMGIYGGFLSNWVGLICFYSSLGFLFWSMKKGSWRALAPAIVLQIALLLSHTFTWWMNIGILAVFLLMSLVNWLRIRGQTQDVKMVFAVLAANGLAYLTRNLIAGINPATLEVVQLSQQNFSLLSINYFWETLNRSLWSTMGITLMNPLLLFLAFTGSMLAALEHKLLSRYLVACVAAVAIPFVFGNSISVQTRILYNLPIHIFSLLGLGLFLKLLEKFFNNRDASRLEGLLQLLIVMINLNYAFRCSFGLT